MRCFPTLCFNGMYTNQIVSLVPADYHGDSAFFCQYFYDALAYSFGATGNYNYFIL
ncbi:hypothetical protein GALL_466960 [mine drainage metagenome]|uniref:Uncharacterized protein n=1 Tax=mine drainage metagenome TaxID=410659 RepID=A0A1J5Q2J9_9ZZZZ